MADFQGLPLLPQRGFMTEDGFLFLEMGDGSLTDGDMVFSGYPELAACVSAHEITDVDAHPELAERVAAIRQLIAEGCL